jgi:hypothetical protein
MKRNLIACVVLANLIAFVAGATVPAGKSPAAVAIATRPTATLQPSTKAAGLDVAVALAAGPLEPIISSPARQPSREKKLFYPAPTLDGRGTVPAGCLPYVCDGGLRYDGDPKTPGWQEDSAWIGGYYGDRLHSIPSKVTKLAQGLAPGTLYVLDIEQWKTDVNGYGDAPVEDSIRRFRSILVPIATTRPDVELAVYGIEPAANYYASTNYGISMRCLAKLLRGEDVTDLEAWYIGGVASWDRWGTGSIAMNPAGEHAKAFAQLQAANDRLTFGRDARGNRVDAGGLTAAVTVICPSCYDHQPGDDSIDYIEQSVAEARRVAPGKPVYVFLWATYHPGGGSPRGGQAIDLPEWRTEVAQAFAAADGVILWDTSLENRPDHVRVALEELAAARRAGLK